MFNSAHHALSWAYETTTRPIVKTSGANHMFQIPARGIPNDLLVNLTIYDRHGQAALIIGMVDSLTHQDEREILRARFSRKVEKDDLQVLVYRGCDVSGLGLGAQEAVYRIVRSWFGGNIPYRTVQQMLRGSNQQALLVKSCVYEALDHIHDRAMADITEVFERHGLIREAAYAGQS